jgi:hypothetical protein
MIWCLVVCSLGVTMETRSPTSRFISVDLPTLGLPTIATKPGAAQHDNDEPLDCLGL